MLKKVWQWIEKNEGLILVLLLVVVLRIPSLYEPYWYGDEGIYLVLGQGLRKGLVFYRDIHDNKPPLLYILAAIAGNVFYFRLMLMIWFSTAVVVFFRLMQALMPKNKTAWYVSTLTMIGLTTLTEGNIANAEIFIVLPVVWGMLVVFKNIKLRGGKAKVWKWLGAGLLFSVGFLLKVPGVFDFLATGLWVVFWEPKNIRLVFKRFIDKRVWWLGLGFLGPIGISLVYYYLMGAGERYLRSALMQNIGYLASWSTGEHSTSGFSSMSGLMMRAIILGLSLGVFWLVAQKTRLKKGFSLMVVWFLMALFGALLSERPYPHYLIQPAVPAAILVSYFIFNKQRVLRVIILSLGLITGLSYWQIKFWHYPVMPYYKNFISFATGKKNLREYRGYFDWRVNQTHELAEYLRLKTKPDERVFVWGDEPEIYALSNRLPMGRYTVAYHIIDFNGFEETIRDFDEHKPKVVIMVKYEKRKFPELKSRLSTDYVIVKEIDQAVIYRRI